MIGCPPWVLDDDPRIIPYEWGQRVIAVKNAEAEAAEARKNIAPKKPKPAKGRR